MQEFFLALLLLLEVLGGSQGVLGMESGPAACKARTLPAVLPPRPLSFLSSVHPLLSGGFLHLVLEFTDSVLSRSPSAAEAFGEFSVLPSQVFRFCHFCV